MEWKTYVYVLISATVPHVTCTTLGGLAIGQLPTLEDTFVSTCTCMATCTFPLPLTTSNGALASSSIM